VGRTRVIKPKGVEPLVVQPRDTYRWYL